MPKAMRFTSVAWRASRQTPRSEYRSTSTQQATLKARIALAGAPLLGRRSLEPAWQEPVP